MRTIDFTEFRSHASGLLSEVENGETLVVLRHGKPVAEVSPISDAPSRIPHWKKPGLKLAVRGAGLSAAILQERADEGVL
ncbi:MAG: type II toxin-antitoxin system Phd/YefM family antitoxin [Verrucomicrobia bacterium]|nr:type II toxin-antitoxin system Phd/YefM family antitoxin [Verrucomicrobiota bacterium]